jgi:2-enoate reductase
MKDNDKFDALFSHVNIGNVEIRNRIAMAPMSLESIIQFENSYIDNRCKEYLIQRAKGGVGMIILSCWRVENEIEPMYHFHGNVLTKAALYSFIELNEILHSFDTKVFYQMTAGYGCVGNPHPPGGGRPVSCSEVPAFWDPDILCRELSTKEVSTIVKSFGYWAAELRKAGADGIELHGHEGYLFDQFSGGAWNKRTDKYGGDLEGRLTFAKEVLESIKASAGNDFPVVYRYGLKHNMKGFHSGAVPGEDFKEFGRDAAEGLAMAKILEREGFDALHVDAGAYDSWYWPHPPNYMQHGCMIDLAHQAKQAVDIPVIAVGRMDDPEVAAAAVADDKADLVAVGRGLLADPSWPNKVRSGQVEEIRPCLGCHDACTGRLFNGKPMCCAVNPAVGRELHYAITPAMQKKKVMVIGGGPAGMEAARVAAMRDHTVCLYEQKEILGGHLPPGSVPEFKKDIRRLLAWYELQLSKHEIAIHLGSRATLETIEAESPDEIIVATGSKPFVPPIEGLQTSNWAHCIEVLNGDKTPGRQVVILGGGLVGCEIALWLDELEHRATIIERLPALMSAGPLVSKENKQMTIDLLAYRGIDVLLNTTVERIENNRLHLIDTENNTCQIECDTLIISVGMQPDHQLFFDADKKFNNVRRIGDCLKPRNIQGAVWDAYEVLRRL